MNATELRRLSTFHVIAVAGGITAAAQRIGKAPSAVHHDLRALEMALGKKLFERVGRNLRLTAGGKMLAASVARAMADLDRAYMSFEGATETVAPLRIGTVSGFGRYRLLPRLLRHCAVDRGVEVMFGTHDDIVRALMLNNVDLAVTYRPVVSAPIRCERIAEEELVLVHARGATTTLAPDLLRYVTYEESDYVFGQWFSSVVGRQPERLIRGDHMSELEEGLMAVGAGRGASIVPRDAVESEPWRSLVEMAPTDRRCVNDLFLLGVGGALDSADAQLVRQCALLPAAGQEAGSVE